MGARDRPRFIIAAHAKVNLFLAVGERRSDGYHGVTTILQAIGLADEVTVQVTDGPVVVSCEPPLGIAEQDNLAFRAVESWHGMTGRSAGADVRISKVIPTGGGLGGASADAAAVLAALSGRQGDDTAVDDEVMRVAAELGSDVPFFLGPGTRLMLGRGDEPAEVLPAPDLDLVLVNPGVPASTAAVYARFDRMPAARPRSPRPTLEAVRSGDPAKIASALHNDLEAASCALVPEVSAALRFLEALPTVMGSCVAGSGSTVFGVCAGPEEASEAAEAARERGWWARATTTSRRGLEIVSAGQTGD